MINILEIPYQYFFVFDRKRYDAIQSSLAFVVQLREEDTYEQRTALKAMLTPVFGFREAVILHTEEPSELEDALLEKNERQLELQQSLNLKFRDKARESRKKRPRVSFDDEIRRDAVFYTLFKTGLIELADSAGIEQNWEEVSGRIAKGAKLFDYFPRELIGDTVSATPNSRLAQSLSGLIDGIVDNGILDSRYRRKVSSFWPLAQEISGLGLNEYEISHAHTRNSRYNTIIMTRWLTGHDSLSTRLVNFLGITDVSTWSKRGEGSLLDPITEPDAETVGSFIGYFLFGKRNDYLRNYNPRGRGREWFLDLVETVGRLKHDYSTIKITGQEIAENFGRKTYSDKTSERYHVPFYVTELAKFGLEKSRAMSHQNMAQKNYLTAMHRSALRAWLSDRASKPRARGSLEASLRTEHEDDIRRMAFDVGLAISESRESTRTTKKVYVRNPEIVGYRQAA